MPSIIPNVLIGTSTGAAALVTTLTSHWNGTSTKFALASGVAYDAGDTLCIEPIADPGAATDWQINIRRTNTTTFSILLDPSGTITDAGSTGAGPTGASTMSSYADTWTLNTAATPITWFLCEWDDAVMLITRDTTNSYHYQGFHSGRGYNPAVLGVPGIADGFVNMCGTPVIYGSSGGAYWTSQSSTSSTMRVGATGVTATDWVRTVSPTPSYAVTITPNIGGVYYPTPIALSPTTGYNRYVGFLKYLYLWNPTDTADTRLEDPVSGTDLWLHVAFNSSPNALVIPWPDATPPK